MGVCNVSVNYLKFLFSTLANEHTKSAVHVIEDSLYWPLNEIEHLWAFSNSVKTAARLKKCKCQARSTRIFQLIHTAVNHVFPVAGCILIGIFSLAHSKLKIHDGRTRMWTGDE